MSSTKIYIASGLDQRFGIVRNKSFIIFLLKVSTRACFNFRDILHFFSFCCIV